MDPVVVLQALADLRDDVERRTARTMERRPPWISREDWLSSARNLAAYQALRAAICAGAPGGQTGGGRALRRRAAPPPVHGRGVRP